ALYIVFTLLYTANDIPYWSMSAVITTDPKQRTTIVTMTRLIGGAGSALAIGLFWTINGLFNDGAGVNGDMSFFLTCAIFCVLGAVLMLQGYFNTKERARITSEENRSAENLKLIPKCKPLLLNLIAGALMSVTTIGSTALSTYFIKWNIKSIFAEMSSNTVMSVFTPVINVLPAAAAVIGLLIAPKLIKKFEKRNILLAASALGVISNVAFYFVGYQSTVQLIFFLIGRFFAFLPLGIWSSVTTIMIGDCVDYIEYKTGKRVEGTCFSMLTFMSQFQNSINVAITGLMLGIAGYNGALDANIAQQSEKTLHMIYIMTTLIPAAGYIIMSIPFFFYNFNNKQHKMMLEVIAARNAGLDTTPPPGMFWRRKLAPAAAGSAPYIPPYTSSKIMEMVVLCCPNCGEELAATSGELVRCPHCGNITIV
ncbi:MAG TPA: MFS transporter, partial [Eubacteriales bacterium]|nr:MFS transporter [Eubacteriales bacterium]